MQRDVAVVVELADGCASQNAERIWTTASTVSRRNSPRRIPVRARISTTSRSEASSRFRAAVSSFAVAGSSRNRGRALLWIGESPTRRGFRRGASS
jgi:hypothetical protein